VDYVFIVAPDLEGNPRNGSPKPDGSSTLGFGIPVDQIEPLCPFRSDVIFEEQLSEWMELPRVFIRPFGPTHGTQCC
jgi:hypothetical protein